MNTYRISGADRTTGVDRTIVLEAVDEKTATIAASKDHGVLVTKLRLVPPPRVIVAPPTRDVGTLDYAGAGNEVPAAPVDGFVANGGARRAKSRVPSYVSLAIVIVALRVLGGTALAIAMLLFFVTLYTIASSNRTAGPADVVILLTTVGGPLASGLILFAFGELLACVRDMAINSFRLLER